MKRGNPVVAKDFKRHHTTVVFATKVKRRFDKCRLI
jgi:hypothetical protein